MTQPCTAAVATLVGLLAACGSQRSKDASDPGYQRLVASADMDGRVIGTDDTADATVVVVFASWCYPCRKELAMLSELAAEQPRLRVIGVNAFEDWDELSNENKLREYASKHLSWLTIVRADKDLLRALGNVKKIPTLMVYDRDGKPVIEYRRAKREPPLKDELKAVIDPLITS